MRLTTGYGAGRPNIWHARELPDAERRRCHGWGSVRIPATLTAGETTDVDFEFAIGAAIIPEKGRLAIAWRWPYDWSDLQATSADQPGFVTIEQNAKNDVRLEFSHHPFGGIEPFHHYLALTVQRGALVEGDRVRIHVRGWRAPTCAVRNADFLLLLDPSGQSQWIELPAPAAEAAAERGATLNSNHFRVVPGPAVRLVVVAPSDALAGRETEVIVRAEDQWGNVTHLPDSSLILEGGRLVSLRANQAPPAYHLTTRLEQTGTHRLLARHPSTGFSAESNPIRVHATVPSHSIFWADLHSGQSQIGCGLGTIAEHYAYARDAVGVQIITHQANDHYVTVDDWRETREQTEAFYSPGRFVTILGCEWSPPTKDGGDRNVFYNYDERRLRRSGRFFTEQNPDDEPDIPDAPGFHACFRDLDVLVNMHVGGRMTNLDWHEPKIERLAEVHSTHGTVEWFVRDCLQRGYRVGVTAGTDGVMGRPGACHPGWRLIRNVRNGLTAIFAPELTREAIWTALQQRRCYATTGERLLLWVEVDGQPMGSELQTSRPPTVRVQVEGTQPIECVDLFRGTERIHTWQVAKDDSDWVRVLWSGTEARGTARRQRVDWHGSLAIGQGSFLDVVPIGFQSSVDQLLVTPSRLQWQSVTAGDDAGLAFRYTGGKDTAWEFKSSFCRFSFFPTDVAKGKAIAAGGLDKRVAISRRPRTDGPKSVQLVFQDDEPRPGWCPYWVRVTQIDRNKAWSTPVYVRFQR
ncbi:MAG: DUF3604 domain-containing protein [Gemmatales bacterium]|nr:MAG: DUF3604 domain-containing protein [Gemmatales bacterium]